MFNKYINLFSYLIKIKLNLLLFKKLNLLLIKGKFGIIYLFMPKFYFYKIEKNDKLLFCFLNKYYFYYLLKQFFFIYKIFFKFYYFRLKLKGLGYRIKKITKKIYRFFLAYNHYFYFFVPLNIFIWQKKRNFLILSFDKIKLNNLFNQLILLKKLDFLEKTNSFISPKKILYLKKFK